MNVRRFSREVPVFFFCDILTKPKLLPESLEKTPNLHFHENPSNGNRVVPCAEEEVLKDW